MGMNYAWEAVLLAEKSKKDRDSLRFIEAACPSPYIEVSVTDLNAQTIEGDTIEIIRYTGLKRCLEGCLIKI